MGKSKGIRVLALMLAIVVVATLTVSPLFAADFHFDDVKVSAWYHKYVGNLYLRGIVGGFKGTNDFKPNDPITREQAAKMIAEAAGLNYMNKTASFDDVASSSWSTGYIAALVELGAVSGYKGTRKFGPKDNIKRSHAAKIVAKAFGLSKGELKPELSDLPRDKELSSAINLLASNGIVKGYKGTNEFRPDGEITRAEFSKIVDVAMTIKAVQKAEAGDKMDSVRWAQSLVDALPDNQDREIKAALNQRVKKAQSALDKIALEGGSKIRHLKLDRILETVEEPKLNYTLKTEVAGSRLSFSRYEGTDVLVTLNGLPCDDSYYLSDYEYYEADEWFLSFEIGKNTLAIEVFGLDGLSHSVYTLNVIRSISSKAIITDLSLSRIIEAEANPKFTYSLETYYDSFKLEYRNPYGADLTIKFNGMIEPLADEQPKDLQWGKNTLEISVKSEDGKHENTYRITINRIKSDQAVIEYFYLVGIMMDHNPDFDYVVETTIPQTSLTYTYHLGGEDSAFFNGAPYDGETVQLKPGENTFRIKIVSADGKNTNEYNIKVIYRQNCAELRWITITDWYWSYNTNDPFTEVETNDQSVRVAYENPNDVSVAVTLNGKTVSFDGPDPTYVWASVPLVMGENVLVLKTTSKDGSEKNTYTVKINRVKRELSDEAEIRHFSLSGIMGKIRKPALNYSFETKMDYTHICFEASLWAEVTMAINGKVVERGEDRCISTKLDMGVNKILIHVKSEDGTQENLYSIVIIRS